MNNTILQSVEHRPYPLPQGPWIMTQTWVDLLFAHWPVAPAQLRRLVPHQLELDTFDGTAWVAVVPFGMENVRFRGTPAIPGISAFLELNVRTYVIHKGRPGVYFFSLDAANPLAVEAARLWFQLPYFNAEMKKGERSDGSYSYQSKRTDKRGRSCRFESIYQPKGPVFVAATDSIEHWLTERYCLYTTRGNKLIRGEIHHLQWPLQIASATIAEDSMLEAAGIQSLSQTPLLHFAKNLVTYEWAPRLV